MSAAVAKPPDEDEVVRRGKPTRGETFRDNWGNVCVIISAIILGINGVTSGLDLTKTVGQSTVFAGFLGLAGLVGIVLNNKGVSHWRWRAGEINHKLSETLNRAGSLAASRVLTFRMALKVIAADLSLGDDERITLYGVPGAGEYTVVGRYSDTADYDGVRHQTRPRNEGCIAEAIRNADLVVYDIAASYTGSHEAWVKEQIKHGVGPATAQVLKMPARSYAALRIRDDTHCVGVIVCESTVSGRFTASAEKLEATLRRHEPILAAFAREAAAHGTYLTTWQQGGF
jgi:acyl-CoA synthetase (AMP-forming)/AMP-acid ligase II